MYTLSLQHVKIILGRTLMKKVSEDDGLKENDVVYFKLTSSALSSTWHIGKVEYVLPSKDMNARKVGISYKHDIEDGSRKEVPQKEIDEIITNRDPGEILVTKLKNLPRKEIQR